MKVNILPVKNGEDVLLCLDPYEQNPMNKIIENKVIEAVQRKALELQPIIEERPTLVKDNIYEIALLQTALRHALNNNTDTILEEIGLLTLKAWGDANL